MTWRLQGRSRIMRFDETLDHLVFANKRYVEGKLVAQLVAKRPFKCNVQPLRGRDLLLVPEHQRFIEQYWCFAPAGFFERTGEVVHRKGVHYQVQDIEYWGSYEKIRIMRVDVGIEATP